MQRGYTPIKRIVKYVIELIGEAFIYRKDAIPISSIEDRLCITELLSGFVLVNDSPGTLMN